MASKINTGFHAPSAIEYQPRNEMDRLRLLLDGRRIVDSDHAALRNRRRQAQAVAVRARPRKVSLPRISLLKRPD